MFKRISATLVAILITGNLCAQDTAALEARVREMARQIEVLTQEIEAIKTRQTAAAPVADQEQQGLGAAASKIYRVESGISFGGYGEMLYENYSARTDASVRTQTRDKVDMLRGVLYTGYKYNDRVLFNSEIEFEHGSTGLGGEASVEFAYLDFLVKPNVGLRGGLLLVPMGLVNEQHEPTTYLTARRSTVENGIIPTTWREMGIGAFGEHGPVSWRAYVVNSVRGDRFAANGIRGGRQKGANAQIEDLALTGRVDWQPIAGTVAGASFFVGDTGQGSTVAGDVVDGKLTMFDLHAETQFRGATLRGLWTRAMIDDAARLNTLGGHTGNRGIGEVLGGWYLEGGYDLSTLLNFGERSLTPYVRYEQLDTQRRVPVGWTRNPANDQRVLTYGIQFRPVPQTVIKADYQNFDNEAGTGLNQWNIALGYIF